MKTTQYQPKTGQPCHCRQGRERDNCQACEGTGQRIDFAAIRAKPLQATHTPGPWRIGDAGHTVFVPPNGQPAPERIATLANRHESTRHNARLIAAAPDMLAALRQVAGCFSDDGRTCSAGQATLAMLRAAIARAEEGQP